jgi:hypothetical protein
MREKQLVLQCINWLASGVERDKMARRLGVE